MILISLIAAIAMLLHCGPTLVSAKDTVTITGGQISGTVQDGIQVYKGIPFAAPPVGPNRWRAPQPVVPWSGVRKADEYGPAPMQNRATAVLYSGNQEVKVSEDCLYLNVWTPVAHKGQKLPVMVWTYGGGFTSGLTGSPLYDGTRLAKHGVIVVSVAYRLGPFGFLATPALSRESGHGSGTYGLQDQIAGLRWVKRNIAQFGGDPSNVTIFGESAGGESTSMLAASPQAHGLFQKVISESGSSFAPIKYGTEFGHLVPSLTSAEKQGTEFLQTLGAGDIIAARGLSADTIQKAASGLTGFPFWPARDGYILPDDQYRMYLAGHFNDTPILVGTNSDDGGMFSPASLTSAQFEAAVRAGFGDKADTILAAYPHETDAEAIRAVRGLVRDVTFAWGTWSWARLQTQHGKGAAYCIFNKDVV
jgi:para-nitrobenzyl esterase